ncbi:glucose dehydrogenase [Caerostris extrusa]|uniref:Glucose dehydrogenase n=1 Tax=Caerostris extrusa TaxID=172846 RepID=A0AAV4VHL6_CAEEX|nr:glucose dehydrogenase [Caerostris extrusa]
MLRENKTCHRILRIPVKADLPVGQNLQEQYGVLTEFELGDKIELFSQKIRKEANLWNYIMSKTGPLTSVTGVSNIAFLSQGFPESQNDLPDYQLYFLEGAQ